METTPFCTSCGAPSDSGRFCTHCGGPLTAEAPVSSEPVAETAPTSESETSAAASPAATATATTAPAADVQAASVQRPPTPHSSSATLAAPARSPRTRPAWVALAVSGVLVLGVLVVAVIVLITTGGKPAARASHLSSQQTQLTQTLLAGRELYAATQQPSYSALLPAGWSPVTITNPTLSHAVSVRSPLTGGATITVGQIISPAKKLSAEGKQITQSATAGAASASNSSAITLAGGRPAWTVSYNTANTSVAHYLVSSCSNTYAVVATVPKAQVALLRNRVATVASTLQGVC